MNPIYFLKTFIDEYPNMSRKIQIRPGGRDSIAEFRFGYFRIFKAGSMLLGLICTGSKIKTGSSFFQGRGFQQDHKVLMCVF